MQDKKMERRRHILVVDDERDLAELLACNLEHVGFRTTQAYDGRSALYSAAADKPDLVVLDIMLPELSGTEVAARLRASPATAQVPIILLTAKSDEIDQMVGFTVGADDYVTKPFSMKVLLARVEAVLRRVGDSVQTADLLRLGPVEIDTTTHEARVDGRAVRLTLTEFRLLTALLQAGGRVLSRASLMGKAIGPGVVVTDRTIDVHVTSIRKKLGRHGGILRTVRGVGYRATMEPEAAST
jgi:DNA-binding response OmpR family regulator